MTDYATVADKATADVPPLDLGIGYAWSIRRYILLFAIVPVLLEVITAYRLNNFPQAPERAFPLLILHLAATMWMFAALSSLIYARLADESIGLGRIAFRGLRMLAKPLLSYLALTFTFVCIIYLKYTAPLVLLVVFLMWAPLFCIFEFLADEADRRAKGTKANGRANGHDAPDDDEAPATYLTRKMPWHLGFTRSVQFTSAAMRPTFSIALLMISAELLPGVTIGLLSGNSQSMAVQIVRILVTGLAGAFVLAAWAATFVALLPAAGKRELFAAKDTQLPLARLQEAGRVVTFEGKLVPHLLLLSCCLLGITYLTYAAQEAGSIPQTAALSVENANVESDRLVVTLFIEDNVQKFRWLDARNFRLAFPEEATLPVEQNQQSESPPPTVKVKQPLVEEPERVVPAYADGTPGLDPDYYVPSSKPLRIVLYFRLPKGALPSGEAKLHYATFSGLGAELASVSYGDFS